MKPKIWNCRCSLLSVEPPRTEIGDLGAKLSAQILLADRLCGIVVPSREEMIGFYLLERDDELPPRHKLN